MTFIYDVYVTPGLTPIGVDETEGSTKYEGEINPDEDYSKTLSKLNEWFSNYMSKYEKKWQKDYEEGYPDALGDIDDYLKLMNTLPPLETTYLNMV